MKQGSIKTGNLRNVVVPKTKIKKLDLALSILSGLIFTVAFISPYGGAISWFILVPFLISFQNKSPWQAFKLGILTGVVANGLAMYWLVETLKRFGGFPYPVSLFLHIAISTYSSLIFAVFGFLVAGLGLSQL